MAGSRPAGGISNHFPQHSSQQVLGSKLERSDEVISYLLIFIDITNFLHESFVKIYLF